MGAYLSSPVTDKISSDECCAAFTYGASSMQGWRISQEDAHNCIPDFDTKIITSMFAVYDGHGGLEVAQYCSRYLPDCIKDTDQYKEGELGPALTDAFLKFDSTLVQEDIIKELKQLAGVDENDEEDDDDDPVGRAEADDLRAEADLPLEVLLAKYKTPPGSAAARSLRKKENFQSPVVRAKKNGSEADAGPSSSSEVAGGSSSNSNSSRAPLINGLADNENNLNKEKELLNSAKSSNQKDSGDEGLKAESSFNDSSSNHTSVGQSCGAGDSGKSIVGAADSSTGCVEGKGCSDGGEKKGEVEGCEVGSSSISASSGQQTSKSSTPSSDGVSSSSSMVEDEGLSASGSSKTGGSSSSNGSGSSGGSGSGSSGVVCSKSKKVGEGEVDDEYDSDAEEEDEDEWQDIESGEEEEEDDDDDEEGMEEGEEPMMDMSNEEPGSDSGCTACVVLLRQDQLVVANAGDSRCVLCRGGTAVDLSNDHKPEDEPERERIENAGGRVTADGRVNGGLNLSRAIGDHFYKRKEDLPAELQMITALPDIRTVTVDSVDEFFVVACDGIWNSMSSQDCVDFIKERLKDPAKKAKPSLICEELFDHCLADNTYGDGTGCDNMTCIIVILHHQAGENGLLPSKRCVREFESAEENSEKRQRVEEGEEDKAEGGKEAMATSSE